VHGAESARSTAAPVAIVTAAMTAGQILKKPLCIWANHRLVFTMYVYIVV